MMGKKITVYITHRDGWCLHIESLPKVYVLPGTVYGTHLLTFFQFIYLLKEGVWVITSL